MHPYSWLYFLIFLKFHDSILFEAYSLIHLLVEAPFPICIYLLWAFTQSQIVIYFLEQTLFPCHNLVERQAKKVFSLMFVSWYCLL